MNSKAGDGTMEACKWRPLEEGGEGLQTKSALPARRATPLTRNGVSSG